MNGQFIVLRRSRKKSRSEGCLIKRFSLLSAGRVCRFFLCTQTGKQKAFSTQIHPTNIKRIDYSANEFFSLFRRQGRGNRVRQHDDEIDAVRLGNRDGRIDVTDLENNGKPLDEVRQKKNVVGRRDFFSN